MQTINERINERYQQEERQRTEHLKACLAIAAEIEMKKDTPLHSGIPEAREALRIKLASGTVDLYPFVCEVCATQLTNPYPHVTLTSLPPKKHVACPGCGWTGTTRA
jgi:hypothetical protein